MSNKTTEHMGFVRVACMTADLLRQVESVKPHSALTDMDGRCGEPEVFTEWGTTVSDGSTRVVMREIYWPKLDRDCEHWVPAPGFDYRAWAQNHG